MASIADWYYYAETHNIIIDDRFELETLKGISMPLANGLHIVGLHPSLRGEEYRECLVHEIAHCATNSFYNEKTPCYTRGQCENKAYKWQVHKMLPFDKFKKAMENGNTETWQLAEHFGVSEKLIEKAIEIYKSEGRM